MPEGWVAELRAEIGMVWVAFIYDADAPRSQPMFTICRFSDHTGLFAQWMNGRVFQPIAFAELWPVLELVLDGIFAAMQVRRATVPAEGWTHTRH